MAKRGKGGGTALAVLAADTAATDKALQQVPAVVAPEPRTWTGMRKVLISSPKGGSGKTELTKNLAVAAALDGRSVAVVDLDRQRTLTKWFGRRPDGTVAFDAFEGSMAEADKVREIEGYDIVFVDTPPSVEDHPQQIKALILWADYVLVPSQPSTSDTESVAAWMPFIQALGKPAAFVLNRVNRKANSLDTAKRALNRNGLLCPIEVPQYEDFLKAAATGYGILEVRGLSGADDIDAVWRFLANQLGAVR